MPTRIAALALAALGTLALSCAIPWPAPAAAADVVSQSRETPSFDRVRLTGVFETAIEAGSERTRVTISASPADAALVTTEVRGGTLEVGMKPSARDTGSIHLRIALPVLRGFTDTGVGNTTVSGLTGDDIDIAIPGAASLTATGRAGLERITLDGAGRIDVAGVQARDVEATSNGVGGIYVRASGMLAMTVNGVGEIRYAGNPAHVESHVNGVGRIDRM